MTRLLIFLTLSAFSTFHVEAQTDSLVNSGRCISKAIQYYDSGKYEFAIKELKRIDPRDTNYVYSLSELAKAYFENKQYKEAVATSEEGLKIPSPYRASLFHSMAIGYNEQGKFDRAQSTLTDALKEFPFDYTLTYRIGVILYGQDKFDEAETEFFRTLDLTPFHMGSHLYLSKIAMRRGNKVKGMFAMGIYLALNNKENTQLQVLENFVKNELTDEKTIPEGSFANPFSRLDEIIRAKISFDEDYKTKIPIDVGIVRQYQLLFEQIKEQNYSESSPWITFYLTVYKDLIKADSQESFVYHILQSSSIEDVKKWAEKNGKVLQKFYTTANNALTQFRGKRTLPEKWGYTNPVACTYDDNSHMESIGDKDQNGNKIGKWYYYFENGQKQAEGNYNQGKKVKIWSYFRNSGAITSIENEDTGEIKTFNPEGVMTQHYFLKNQGIEGIYELFYSCGALYESRGYHDGKKNGIGKTYFRNGSLEAEFSFKNDSLEGKFTNWHETGKIESELSYVAGKASGKYISYYNSGKEKANGNYQQGEADGVWLYFHENGLLSKKGSYKNDLLDGTWDTFNKQGKLIERKKYEPNNSYEEDIYYHETKLFYVVRLKQDKVIALTFYDKSGAVAFTYENGEGTFKGKGFFPTGQLQVELEYSKGVRSGLWKYYSRYGTLESVCNYKEGLLQGEYLEYYPSGTLKTKSHYADGKLEGLFTEYYKNGIVRSIGWFSNGMKQQKWLNFYVDGSIESDSYFLNDIITGYTLDYTEDKKLYSKFEYTTDGKVKSVTKYNDAGSISSKAESNENHHLVITKKNQSGNVSYKTEYLCGELNGETSIFLRTGKPYKTLNYLNGKLNGRYNTFYPDGKVDGVGFHITGKSSGTWKWSNVDGSKHSQGRYVDGDKDSVWIYYYYNGKMSNISNFIDDKKEGESQIFGLDGQLVLYKKFEAGEIIAYKAIGKDGKQSDWIPFSGQGEISSYYSNGNLASLEFYKNGEFDGTRKAFYPSGQLFSIFEYKNGMTQGEAYTYYPNGKIKEKYNYKDDLPTGIWEYYDSNGNLYQKESYRSGTLCGDVEFFSNGKKVQVQNFFGGFPID